MTGVCHFLFPLTSLTRTRALFSERLIIKWIKMFSFTVTLPSPLYLSLAPFPGSGQRLRGDRITCCMLPEQLACASSFWEEIYGWLLEHGSQDLVGPDLSAGGVPGSEASILIPITVRWKSIHKVCL